MTAINDITGDLITTKVTSQKYKDNYDKIFGNKCNKVDESACTSNKVDDIIATSSRGFKVTVNGVLE